MMMTCLILMFLLCWISMARWPLAVLILSLGATVVFFLVGLDARHDWVVILSPGLFLSCYIYVGFFLSPEEHYTVRAAARLILAALLLLLLVMLVGAIFGPLVMAGALMFAVWLAAMIAYGSTARRSLLFSVLTTLKTSMRQNLPLPMALDCAAQGRVDQEGAVYRQIKKQLVMGRDLVEAIRVAWPQCPGHVTGVLEGAQRVGGLGAGLEAVHKNVTLRDKRKQACEPIHPLYPVMVLAVVGVIVTALFQYVIPQFAATLQDMVSGELPLVTRWLLSVYGHWGMPVITCLVVGVGIWAIVTAISWMNRGRRPAWIAAITDWVRWNLPFVHRFDRMFALIQLLETLNLCLSAGCPVDEAVRHCQGLDVNRCFVRKIRKWHRLIVQGQTASSAALKTGLPRAVAWAFDTTVNQGNTPGILCMLEETYSDRYVYHSNLLSLVLGPFIIMMLAAVVCIIMLAVFLPMITVITSLTGIYP